MYPLGEFSYFGVRDRYPPCNPGSKGIYFAKCGAQKQPPKPAHLPWFGAGSRGEFRIEITASEVACLEALLATLRSYSTLGFDSGVGSSCASGGVMEFVRVHVWG